MNSVENLCETRLFMKFLLLAASSLLLLAQLFAEAAPAKPHTIRVPVHPRTIQNLPNFVVDFEDELEPEAL